MKEKELLLETKGLTKKFPGTLANDHINIKINKGEVHAIVGENGAGKSTFCNILTGALKPDEGELIFNGKVINLKSTADAILSGISMVHQERNLVPIFNGAENILLRNEPIINAIGVLDKKNALKEARKVLLSFEEEINLPLDVPVRYLSQGQQQLVEIIRSCLNQNKLLILDEPTSSLSEDGTKLLFRIIKKITANGTSVIFVSHKLDEVFYISDSISVFRNGRCVKTKKTSELSKDECISLMVNRNIGQLFPEYSDSSSSEIILEGKDICDSKNELKNVNFKVRKGEKIGWYGLVGSGRTELAELIMGIRTKKNGSLKLNGKEIENISTVEMRKNGCFLIPEERRTNSEFPHFTVGQNVGVAFIDKIISSLGLFIPRKEYSFVEKLINSGRFTIKYGDLRDGMDTLSGGNKQKIIISRGIYQEGLKLLIADEPTQGIDVGAKYDIYELTNLLTKQGVSIVFISSELLELIGICDRICIFHKGNIIAELEKDEFDSEKIISYAFGMKTSRNKK